MSDTTPIPPASERERTPQDYAIEHAEYMATSAESLIEAVNDLARAESEHGDGLANESDVIAAGNTLSEAQGDLRERIYEFRKRRDRAALSHPSTQGWKQIGWTCGEGDCGRIHEAPGAEGSYAVPVYVQCPPEQGGKG